MKSPTAADIDAATDAYIAQRYPNGADWKAQFPTQYAEIRERMTVALEAAAKLQQIASTEQQQV